MAFSNRFRNLEMLWQAHGDLQARRDLAAEIIIREQEADRPSAQPAARSW